MNMISKLYFDVASSLISQSAFAMTSAIVVLTRPSALPNTEPTHGELLFRMRSSSFSYLLHTSIAHQPAVGLPALPTLSPTSSFQTGP